MRLKTLLSLILLAVMLSTGPASAARTPWPQNSYSYFAENEPLASVLQVFTQNFGLRLQAGRGITGTVDGRFFATSPGDFLDRLGQTYGFQWFHYSGVLYVNTLDETTTRSIMVPANEMEAMRTSLTGVGLLDERFGWGPVPERNVVVVSGPPPYVDLISSMIATLPRKRESNFGIAVYRLRHASAEDRVYNFRDKEVTIPGVATVLRNVVSDRANANASGRTTRNVAVVGATQVERERQGSGRDGGDGGTGSGGSGGSGGGRDSVAIQADPRQNAIIVRDSVDHLPMYDELIPLLDVPASLIEIEAVVVDVNRSKTSELGIRWRGQTGNVAGGYGRITSATASSGSMALAVGGNVNLTTLLSDAGSYFLTMVDALEENGDARTLSRPSVLTVDNLEALLDLSETFYVRVTGERVAELQPITTGTMLRVTPHLIRENDQIRVQMMIDIEDGAILADRQVDNIPTVRRSTISTQAVVTPDESLLIGGYYLDSESKTKDGVPGLGDIPLLGLLFSQNGRDYQKRERLFMITPKIVTLAPG